MQASQSNTAAGFVKPASQPSSPLDSKLEIRSDATSSRIPSAFTSPIQAARKYLERQRSDAWLGETKESQTGLNLAGQSTDQEAHGESKSRKTASLAHANREQVTLEQTTREQMSRERDRRLERSLYEGHSIEASLSFETGHGEGGQADDKIERAYLTESDGSEPLFSYAAPVTSPDPSLVREAIFRLARESELRRETVHAAWPGLARDLSTESPVPQPVTAIPAEAVDQEPVDFAQVARRVWGADDIAAGGVVLAMESVNKSVGSLPQGEIGEHDAPLQGMKSEAGSEQASARAELQARGLPAGELRVCGCDVERESALAHDACNLLSALGLYSDLLSSPGVLAGQHRHYAEELKLLAGRSQVLIDRLMRVAAAHVAEDSHAATQVANTGITGAPAVAVGSGLDSQSGTRGTEAAVEEVVVKREAMGVLPDGESEPSSIEVQHVSLTDLLMRWGSLLSTIAQGTLEVAFGPRASTPIPVAAEALERILVNLVRNARAATVAGGAIRIGVGVVETSVTEGDATSDGLQIAQLAALKPMAVSNPDSDEVALPLHAMALTVDDSGCGMSETQVQRILGTRSVDTPSLVTEETAVSEGYGRWPGGNQVQREHAAEKADVAAAEHRTRQGLGLQIVRELVAQSGGSLSIQSRLGSGTRIEIRWPVVLASADEPAAAFADDSAAILPDEPVVALADKPVVAFADDDVMKQLPAATPDRIHGIALAAEPQSHAHLQDEKEGPVGPDGFSEEELRAMMLRLQRVSPHERSPFSRRLGERRPLSERRPEYRTQDKSQNSTKANLPVEQEQTGHGFSVLRLETGGQGLKGSVTQEAAGRGAIAC